MAELARATSAGGTSNVGSEGAVVQTSPPLLSAGSSSVIGHRSTADEEPEVEWLLREADAGRLEGFKPTELPPLPEWATVPMRRVAELFAKVHGCRQWAGDGRDPLFVERWVSRKVGLPKTTVHRALMQLGACGVLVRGERLYSRGGKRRAQLWAPGPLPGAAVGVERRPEGVGHAGEVQVEVGDELLVLRAVGDREAGGGRPAGRSGAGLHRDRITPRVPDIDIDW